MLVDLAGWTKRARPALLAARPAPCSCSGLAIPARSERPGLDYIVADHVLIRPQDEPHFLKRLSGSRIATKPTTISASRPRRRNAAATGFLTRSMGSSSLHPSCSIVGCGCCERWTGRCSGCCSPRTAAGLPELITSSLSDYCSLALRLAGDAMRSPV